MKQSHDFRHAHVSAAVGIVLMVIGFLVVGKDPTDTERQVIVFSAAAIAFTVLMSLHSRDHRNRDRR